mmetsp:Transcript_17350/g.34901  ORF Transcript_17350/g.34901 Transcript_17350/m.34901 type:complete len:630 (-) Transcript_17350:2328-4217(-)
MPPTQHREYHSTSSSNLPNYYYSRPTNTFRGNNQYFSHPGTPHRTPHHTVTTAPPPHHNKFVMGRFHFSKKGSRGGFHANADDEINPAHYGRGPSSDDDHGNRGNAAPAGKSKQQKQKQKKKKKKKFHLFSKSHHSKTAKDEDTPSSSPGNTAYSHAVIDGPIDSDTLQVVEASSSGGERRRDDFHTNPSCGDPSLPAERGVIDVGDDDDDDDDFQEYDLGDIPKSISTPTHCDDDDDDDGHFFRPDDHGGDESKTMYSDFESLDSPLSALRKQRARSAALVSANADGGPEKNAAPSTDPSAPVVHSSDLPDLLRIQTALDAPPSLDRLPRYVAALSPVISPDPSADVPSRALRALFALSEHASRTRERIAMVRYGGGGKARRDDDDYDAGVAPLIPTLLSFLRRCRRDSSEQYLALLVLNNVSIPPENKRPIALTHGGLKTLGRMLCDDPGCHLLVIILVNLTFSDVAVRKDFLCGVGGVGGADGMLVDSLAYALLVSSCIGICIILSMMRNFLFVVNIQICQWNAFFQLEPISKHDRFRHHIPPNTIQSKHNPFRSKTAILPDRRTTRRPRLHSPRLRRRHAPPASQTPFPPPIRPFRKSQTRPPCRSPPPRRSSLCRNGAMVSLRL